MLLFSSPEFIYTPGEAKAISVMGGCNAIRLDKMHVDQLVFLPDTVNVPDVRQTENRSMGESVY
jgi:hypothetical protein